MPLNHDDIAFLQYTGGTTGVAKGAILTHRNLVANVQQVAAWVARDLLDGKETAILPLPLYHVYALTSNLVFMKIGAHVILITNPRDLPTFVKTLEGLKFTAMVGVNTLYNALLNAPGFDRVDTHSLKMANAGGMAVQRVVAERWKQVTGVAIMEAYGLTETSPAAIANPIGLKEWSGTIGVPIPSTEAAVLDDQGVEVAMGQVDEICIRGPQVMKGYWNRPDETAKVLTADGWLRTGDMGFMDPRGYFKITDRKKDMIIVSGFKVFPNEIEDVVMMHPGVLEAAAIGRERPEVRRGGQGHRGEEGSGAHRAGAAGALQEEPDRVQGPEVHPVPDRAAAEVQHREDPAPRAARARRRSRRGDGRGVRVTVARPGQVIRKGALEQILQRQQRQHLDAACACPRSRPGPNRTGSPSRPVRSTTESRDPRRRQARG